MQVASILIPESKRHNNPFFSGAARHLVYRALLAFIQHSDRRWTFRDLLLTMRDGSRLHAHLEKSDTTAFLLQHFEHPGTFQNIISTILTHLAPFEIIAAAWDRATEHVSLKQWLPEESIHLLGNSEENRAALKAMNRLIFCRLSELVLGPEELTSSVPPPNGPGSFWM